MQTSEAAKKAAVTGGAAGRGAPRTGGTLLAAALAAVGASLCCVVPFVLLALGIGGAWLASLRALEPYRPLFIAAVLVLLGLAFHRLYIAPRPRTCGPGPACAVPAALRRQRIVFWLVTVLAAALIAFPWYGPPILG